MKERKTEQKEKKNLRETLSSIEKYGSATAKFMSIGILLGTIALSSTFPGESIKMPRNSNLIEISKQHGTTWQRLGKRNNLENPDYVQAGQNLIIYDKGPFGFFQKAYDTIDKYWF